MSAVSPRRKPRIPPPLHELEAEVMDQVWRRDEVTVREVLDALNAGPKQRAYTTIMTIMSRLHEKGLLDRRRSGKSDVYRPVMSREQYLDVRAKREVDELVADYGELALAHFARQLQTLDPKRREQLRRLAKGSS
jgi:BlaI family transcriptional regulator, penicillinase repressor